MAPARRAIDTCFDEVDGDPARFKCKVCSANYRGRPTLIQKTSDASHLRSTKHKMALTSYNSVSTPSGVAAESSNLADMHLDPAILMPTSNLGRVIAVSGAPYARPRSPQPFDDVAMYENQYFNAAGEEIMFSAGEELMDGSSEHLEELRGVIEDVQSLEHYNTTLLAGAAGYDEVEEAGDELAQMMNTPENIEEKQAEDDFISSHYDPSFQEQCDWAPHGSKTMFLLDLLDNQPRLRLSDELMRSVIWVMKECGAPNVPSLSALRAMQTSLTEQVGIPSKRHVSALGNIFYTNHPLDLLALDWANPFVCPLIQVYPEVTSDISEFWQAGKWLDEVPLDQLTPMWADFANTPHRHFYVNELSQLHDGRFVIPRRWVQMNKIVYAEVYIAIADSTWSCFVIEDHEIVRVPALDIQYGYLDLVAQGRSLNFFRCPEWAKTMPHPVRAIAQGRPAFCLRISIWADGVSGNRSKQFNPHDNLYIENLNLPHRNLMQEYFVRFSSTSPDASSLEQLAAIQEDLCCDSWKDAYHCTLKREMIFQVHSHVYTADNPKQAEECSQSGTNKSCRRDDLGGPIISKETDAGYEAHFSPANARTPLGTIEVIKKQLFTACLGVRAAVDIIQTETGIADKIANFWIDTLLEMALKLQKPRLSDPTTRDPQLNDRTLKGANRKAVELSIKLEIQKMLFGWLLTQPPHQYDMLPINSPLREELRAGDHYNPALAIRGSDPHQDTPLELLHTKLLGDDEFLWTATSKGWNKQQDDLFAARLQSSSLDGLSISSLRADYMVHYKGSLIGRHFKALQQLGAFHLHEGLCDKLFMDLWKVSGELGALLWYPEISNMPEYLDDLQILIDNLLDLWVVIEPSGILTKTKFHQYVHAPTDVQRFGPLPLVSTEVFEGWNAVFRMCSILSNHQAPSRDIAITLAEMERFKHQASGGWWKDMNGNRIRAGEKVRAFFIQNKDFRRRLGWADEAIIQSGTATLESANKQFPSTWRVALGLSWAPEIDVYGGINIWYHCKSVVALSGDICKPKSWVFYKNNRISGHDSDDSPLEAGRILKILTPSQQHGPNEPQCTLAIIECFVILNELDARLNMPQLVRHPTDKVAVVKPSSVQFIFNAQHDCHISKCVINNEDSHVRQGCDVTKIKGNVVVHTDIDRFLANKHALHNAHLLRKALPRHLTKPSHIFVDRKAKHRELAAQLRVSGPARRAEIIAKGQATRAQNNKAKAGQKARAQQLETVMENTAAANSSDIYIG